MVPQRSAEHDMDAPPATTPRTPDVWGRIYLDYWEDRPGGYQIERDDGLLLTLDSAASYFEVPRSAEERELLELLEGPVLDLGCGPGSYALWLQDRGLSVTAGDVSPGAVRLCSERGCRDARVMDVRTLRLPEAHYGSIIVMGNTLGVHQGPDTLPELLRALRAATRPGGQLLCATADPLATDDPAHLGYHQRNRERGHPPGLTNIRMRCGEEVDDWVQLWLLTTEELAKAMAGGGWTLKERRIAGPQRVDLYH